MNRRSQITRCRIALPLLSIVLLGPASAFAADYEKAGKVRAATYLDAESMSGPEWKVAAEAENDGAINTYVVESRFGDFEARSKARVAIRGKEVEALTELERVSKTDVFTDAVKESALGSVKTVQEFAENPSETLKAVPNAVGRFFKKTKFQAEELYVDAKQAKAERDEKKAKQESGEIEKEQDEDDLADKSKEAASEYALKYLKISSAERRWYKELGVDPYTDNQPLRDAIESYSRIEGLTRFGMRFAGIPKIPGASELRDTMELVWDVDPWELRMQNREKLEAAGVSEETARAFEDNPNLSLTMQTGFVAALGILDGVAGRQHLLARAIDLESPDEGQALVQSTALLLNHHRGSRPLAEILPGARLPVARTKDGRMLATLSADALFWTERVAEAALGFFEIYAEDSASIREFWTVGEASDRFKSEAKQAGWQVMDRWQVVDP